MLSSPELWREFFETYYRDEINKLAERVISNGTGSIHVDFLRDLAIFREGRPAEELLKRPDIVIKHAEKGLTLSDNIHDVSLEGCKVRFINLPTFYRVYIKNLRGQHVSRFVSIEGIVRKITEVRPKIVEAVFECGGCGNKEHVEQEGSAIEKPYECKNCKSRRFVLKPEESKSVDSQRIKIQEYPESLRGGEQPQTLDIILEGDLTGRINPGDRIIVNGIVRTHPRTVRGKISLNMDIFLEGNSIEIIEKEYEEFEITEKDRERILGLSNDPDIYNKIVQSIAPSIYGHEDVKLAIALQLFGSVPKKLPDGTEIRGDIHVLLVGDPGLAKSQILRYVHRIAPRSVYTTGKGTTYAGLTCSATKDEYDGRWTLEAGALVLADKGMALVDEIDKMHQQDRSALHEALEQQTVSVAKAGINAVLRARCALLGAANPKYGRFDRYAPIAEQIDLSPTLLSRFDLIFVMTDNPDEVRDRELAKHILNTHELGEKLERARNIVSAEHSRDTGQESKKIEPAIDPDLLRKYIAYAKRTVFPVLNKEAKEKIERYYLSLRSRTEKDAPIAITARQLEGLIRLTEASARLRLSDHVTIEDLERAIMLVETCLKQIAVDQETGEVDIDLALTGTSKTQRDRIVAMKRIIEELEDSFGNGVPQEEILEAAEKRGIEKERVEEILHKLKEMGEVYSPRTGRFKVVSLY